MRTFKYICIMTALLSSGCAQNQVVRPSDNVRSQATARKQTVTLYKGLIIDKSDTAKTIAVRIGKGDQAETMTVKFDDKTMGIKHAAQNHNAVIAWEKRGHDRYATVIKPELNPLPPEVTKIEPQDVKELLDDNTNFILIDARPALRFARSHLPKAVSIPVSDLTTPAEFPLPEDRDKLLVFYGEGST